MSIVKKKYKNSIKYYKVYSDLICAARNKITLTYVDVARVMEIRESGNHMGAETGHLLGEISENEHDNDRPMLSAIAIKTNSNRPEEGFYTLACQLGKLGEDATVEEKRSFWKDERDQVYKKWSD